MNRDADRHRQIPDVPDLAAVRAAANAQQATTVALRAVLTPEQDLLLEALLNAAERRYRAGYWHLAGQLADMFPGVGPAVRFIAEELESRIDR